MPKATAKAEEKQHPVYKNQSGSVQLAVWANDHVNEEDGEVRTFHTINLERNYKDAKDDWQKTSQLRERDLGDAIALLQSAQQYLMSANDA